MTQSPQVKAIRTLRSTLRTSDLKIAISAALEDGALESSLIGVTTDPSGGVALRGTVGTPEERRQATHACWAVAGITSVDNQLCVTH